MAEPTGREPESWRRAANGTPQAVPALSSVTSELSPVGALFHHTTLAPGSWSEGYLTRHALALHLNAPKASYAFPGWGRRVLQCQPGALQFCPALRPFAVSWNEPYELLSLAVEPEFYARFVEPSGTVPELHETLEFSDPVIEQLLLALDGEVRDGNLYGQIYTESLTAGILARLLRSQKNGEPRAIAVRSGATLSSRTRELLLSYIEENLHRPLRLRELSDVVELNLMNLLKRFKVAVGDPPHRYILKRRLERAKRLLRHSTLPISEIALRCGFSEQSSFTRAFRRVVRVTPAAFRRAL
jgi:AraC family transcriptional regulator